MNAIARLLLLSLAVLVAACAPMTPAPTGGSWPNPPTSGPGEKSPEKPAEKSPAPIKSGEARTPSPAVQSLLDKGWAQYRNKNFQGALGYAERAQRIDARSPEIYLLMASAQFSLYRYSVAEQLVRRGLSITTRGTAVYRELNSLLNRISAASR